MSSRRSSISFFILIRHRDRVVSKDQLLEAVWQGRVVSESALSTRINAARQAIGDSGEAQEFIQTLARRGFRFVATVEEAISADAAACRHASSDGGACGPPLDRGTALRQSGSAR